MLDEGLFSRGGALGRKGLVVRLGHRGWVWRVGLGNGRGCGSGIRFCMWCHGVRVHRVMLRRVYIAWGVVFIIREM